MTGATPTKSASIKPTPTAFIQITDGVSSSSETYTPMPMDGPDYAIHSFDNWASAEITKTTTVHFASGLIVGDYLWMGPISASANLTKVNKHTGLMNQVHSAWPPGFNHPAAHLFIGLVYDGTSLWMVPYNANMVIQVNPATGTMTGHSSFPTGGAGNARYWSGTYDGRGYVWMMGQSSPHIAQLAISDGSMVGFNSWPPGFLAGAWSHYPYHGAVFDGLDRVWTAPHNRPWVIGINTNDGFMVGFDSSTWSGQGINYASSTRATLPIHTGGTSLYIIPGKGNSIVHLNTASGVVTGYTSWPVGFNPNFLTDALFSSGAIFDGHYLWAASAFSVPQMVVRFDTLTGTMKGLTTHFPLGFNAKSLSGMSFDPATKSIWFIPREANMVLRLTATTYTGTGTLPSTGTGTGTGPSVTSTLPSVTSTRPSVTSTPSTAAPQIATLTGTTTRSFATGSSSATVGGPRTTSVTPTKSGTRAETVSPAPTSTSTLTVALHVVTGTSTNTLTKRTSPSKSKATHTTSTPPDESSSGAPSSDVASASSSFSQEPATSSPTVAPVPLTPAPSCPSGQVVETSTDRPTPSHIDVGAAQFQDGAPPSSTTSSKSSSGIFSIPIHPRATSTTSTKVSTGEWWESTIATPTQPQQVPGDQFAFRLHARPGGDEEKPDASGILSYRPGNTVNLTRTNSTSFTLEFEVGTGYLIYVAETFDVELLPAYFGCRVPSAPVIIATITVSTRPSDVVTETNTAIAVVTGTAMVGAAVGGGAAVLDAQTLAVLGLMFCAQPVERETLKNNRLLSPLATSNTYEGMILGNWILIVGILSLHVAAVGIATKVKKMKAHEAMALVRFPSLTLIAINIQYQGTGAAAIKLVQNTLAGPSSLALAWITIFMTSSMPFLMFFCVWKGISVSFHEYLHRTKGTDGDESGRPAAVNADATARPVPEWLKLLLPKGKWMPVETRRRFGSLFSGIGRYERFWVTLPLWSPTIIMIGLCFRPPSGIPCSAMYGTLAALQFLLAVVFLTIRPLRSSVTNVLAAGSNAAIGVVCVASAVQATSPNSPNARYFTLKAIQAQIGCMGVRLLWTGCQVVIESKVLAKLPMQEIRASRWNAGGAGSGAEDALHGRDDIQQELLTMNNYTAGAAEAQAPQAETRDKPTSAATAATLAGTPSSMQASTGKFSVLRPDPTAAVPIGSTGANTANGQGNDTVDPFADSSDDDLDDDLL